MSSGSADRENYCYRHPNRQSFVLCQRCGRTICGECQTPAPVGVICPECMKESRASAPRVQRRPVASRLSATGAPVTVTLIVLNVVVFLLSVFTTLNGYLAYVPYYTDVRPWTMLTSLFAHGSIAHIVLNMLALFVLGRDLESLLGKGRFLALYGLAGLGGSVAVLLLDPLGAVIGASGAIFGLFAAYFVIVRRLGGNATSILVIIGINFALGFVLGSISWQAHLGGLVVGAAVGAVLGATRQRRQRTAQVLGLVGIGVALVVITAVTASALF